MKVTLKYEREQPEGSPCHIWCKAEDPNGNIICGKYGKTREEARDRAIDAAKIKIESESYPIESEEVEI